MAKECMKGKAIEMVCRKCGKKNHKAIDCKSKGPPMQARRVNECRVDEHGFAFEDFDQDPEGELNAEEQGGFEQDGAQFEDEQDFQQEYEQDQQYEQEQDCEAEVPENLHAYAIT